jgi:hypothetical protein
VNDERSATLSEHHRHKLTPAAEALGSSFGLMLSDNVRSDADPLKKASGERDWRILPCSRPPLMVLLVFHNRQPFNGRRRSLPNHFLRNLILDTSALPSQPQELTMSEVRVRIRARAVRFGCERSEVKDLEYWAGSDAGFDELLERFALHKLHRVEVVLAGSPPGGRPRRRSCAARLPPRGLRAKNEAALIRHRNILCG